MKKILLSLFMAGAVMSTMAQNPTSEIWDTSNNNLVHYSLGGFGEPIGSPLANFKSSMGKNGCNLYVGTVGGGLAIFDGKNWSQIESSDVNIDTVNVLSNYVSAAYAAANGDIWIGNDGLEGVVRMFPDGSFTNYQSLNSAYPNTVAGKVTAICEDNAGNIYVGTNTHGVAKFDGSTWTVFNSTNSNIPINNITNMKQNTSTDAIWVGTTSGAAFYDGTTWTAVLPGSNVWGFGTNPANGHTWIGGGVVGFGIYAHDGSSIVDTLPNMAGKAINDIEFDSRGWIYIASTVNNFMKYDGMNPPSTIATGKYYDVLIDADDNVYGASDRRLSVLNDSGLVYCVGFDANHVCFGQTGGSLEANPLFGSHPYTYNWSTSDMDSIITPAAGTYSVTITDGSGYTASGSGTLIVATSAVSIDTTLIQPSYGGFDGEIQANVTGGIPPYKYKWSNGKTTATISNLFIGTYTLIVTDSIGCADTISVELVSGITDLNGISGSAVVYPNPTQTTATLEISLDEAATLGATLYSINGQAIQNVIEYSTLGTGTYKYSVNTADLADGVYYLNIRSEHGSTAKKIVVLK